MPLLQMIVVLIVLGVVAGLVWQYLPIPQPFKNIIIILIVLAACLFLLDWAGVLHFSGAHASTLYMR